jgi:hypothetical protein
VGRRRHGASLAPGRRGGRTGPRRAAIQWGRDHGYGHAGGVAGAGAPGAALEIDLIGPYEEREQLDRAPSRFYLTGFLVPREGRQDEPLVEPKDDTEAEDAEAGDKDAAADDVRPAGEGSRRRSILPASLGLSVLLPPGDGGEVTVVLLCAEYAPFHAEGASCSRRPSAA